jgi:hypothetical protein
MKHTHYLLLLFLPLFAKAQISGKVTDEIGEPLPYATVYIRNTSNGTVCNGNGEFRLSTAKGEHEIIFQYIGYNQHVEKVVISDKPVRLDVKMTPSNLELKEVEISSIDPAVRIMKEAIAKRSYHKTKTATYSSDAYIKGFYKLIETPKKIFGEEVGNMGGVLDSTGSGVIYLSESVSKVWSQDPPGRKKEVMISSKVSGSENGFSVNRATLTDFNLYHERLEIEREILSPLADNAFSYYEFKHAGRFKNELGFTIEKIKVIPRRPADPVFSGFLYVVDELWLLSGVDLALTGAAIKQPVLDTLRIQQQFIPLGTRDTWGVLTQLTTFKFEVFGFKIGGFFNGVFSNYDLNPQFDKDFFSKEVFKIEEKANAQPLEYWAGVRPIPLTEEEQTDYVKKDSLQRIWNSKEYMDSLDRKGNKFKFNNLMFGYTWENSYKHTSVSYPAAFKWIQFNTVQGWLLDVQPEWKKDSDERATSYWRAKGALNYGFSEEKVRGSLKIQRRFDSIKFRTFSVEGGTKVEQFNDRAPITPFLNTNYSLFDKRNYMKLYDKAFARMEYSQVITTGWSFRGTAEWAQRGLLSNTTDFTYRRKVSREYTSNDPVPPQAADVPFTVEAPQQFLLEAQVIFRPKQQYSSYPGFRSYQNSGLPEFILNYRSAVPLGKEEWANYDLLRLYIRQEDLTWGLGGYTSWNIGGGLFLRNERMAFMDMYHPIGNQTIFANTDHYMNGFFLLPYYAYSTSEAFAELHLQHHLEGWLLDKIPLIRKLNWKEVFGVNVYYADQPSRDPAFTGTLPYWEVNWGFENIGIKAIRPLRVDVAFGFFGSEFYRSGIVLGVNL